MRCGAGRDGGHPRGRRRRSAVRVFATLACFGISASAAHAQVVLDGSLGPAGARIGPNYVVPLSVGRLVGTNLFHSFSQFNVNQGESLTFTAPGDVPVTNVLARVTGGQPSNIDGLLRSSIPAANIYLINPAGVVFGPEAQLDVGGSFVVTTADRVRLADGATFAAAPDAAADAVLTTASPAAFGFIAAKPAPVTYDGGGASAGLTVPDGAVLSIVAGDVGITAGTLRSVTGRVNIASVASPGEVAFDPTSLDAPLTLTGFTSLGAVQLLQQSAVSVQEGGRAELHGGSLTLNRSSISAQTEQRSGGAIELDFTGAVNLLNARIDSETNGPGDCANVSIKGGAVVINGLSDAADTPISTNTHGDGAGGNVTIVADTLQMSQDGGITTFTASGAPGGSIDVTAKQSVRIDGTGSAFITGLSAETLVGSDGPAGRIHVVAPLVEIVKKGEITNTTRGNGPAGKIDLEAATLTIDGGGPPADPNETPKLTGLQSRVGDLEGVGATGAGGTITVVLTDALNLINGGVLSASTFGRGDGGSLNVTTKNATFSNTSSRVFTGLFARSTQPSRGGRGGDILLNTESLDMTGPSEISAISSGDGVGGAVTVNVARSVTLSRGASITVQAGFDLTPQENVVAPTDSGSITLTAGRDVQLFSGSEISARATQDSNDVKVTAPGRVRLVDSSITAQAGRNGGKIDIDPEVVVLDHSVINGLAAGRDVSVTIDSDALLASDSQILTDTVVLPPEIDIAGSLVRLNAGLASDAAKLAEVCGLRVGGAVSSFVATGRGGTPLQPAGFAPSVQLSGPRRSGAAVE